MLGTEDIDQIFFYHVTAVTCPDTLPPCAVLPTEGTPLGSPSLHVWVSLSEPLPGAGLAETLAGPGGVCLGSACCATGLCSWWAALGPSLVRPSECRAGTSPAGPEVPPAVETSAPILPQLVLRRPLSHMGPGRGARLRFTALPQP